MSRRFQPPAPSVFTVSHRPDGLLRLQPCQACFIPAALLGFHRTSSTRPVLSDEAGRARPGFLFKAFSSSTTSTCWRALLSRAPGPEERNLWGNGSPMDPERHRVSIAEESVYPTVASREHQPS
jgi:hypothetical protein